MEEGGAVCALRVAAVGPHSAPGPSSTPGAGRALSPVFLIRIVHVLHLYQASRQECWSLINNVRWCESARKLNELSSGLSE